MDSIIIEENNLKNDIQDYFVVDQAMKELDKKKKPLNISIKSGMVENGLNSYEADGAVATYSKQERTSLNEEVLLKILKDRGLNEAIEVKEHPRSEVVERMIYEGILSPVDLANCYNVSIVEVLSIKAKKKEKK